MCGLVTVVKRKDDGIPTAPVVLDFFKQQITRGQQGVGYVAFDNKVKAYIRRQSKDEIEKALEKKTARSIMFHHRIPTSTPNLADTTHPIKVSHEELLFDYYVTHNGIISNDSVMHDEHVALGYVYNTVVQTTVKTVNDKFVREEWNDSEAFAIDLCRFIEGKQEKMQSRGSIAFVALQVTKKDGTVKRVYFGHNTGNPLTCDFTDDSLILRSVGGTDEVRENTLCSLDMATWEATGFETPIGEHAISRNNFAGYPDRFNSDDFEYPDYVEHKENISEAEIIKIELDMQSSKLDDKIQDLLDEEAQLIEEIDTCLANGQLDLANQTRIELAKNREKIAKLEEQQAQLGVDTITT